MLGQHISGGNHDWVVRRLVNFQHVDDRAGRQRDIHPLVHLSQTTRKKGKNIGYGQLNGKTNLKGGGTYPNPGKPF